MQFYSRPAVVVMQRFCTVLLFLVLIFASRADAADLSGQNVGSDGDGVGLSMALRADDGVAYSYFNKSSKILRFSEWNGSGWSTSPIDNSLSTLAAVTVDSAISYYSPSALVYLGSVPHVIYYDAGNQRLVHAYRSGASWIKDNVAVSLPAGGAPAAAVCGTSICISYYNGQSKDLVFAKGSAGAWSLTTVDSGGDVGSSSAIAIKPDGYPVIVYYDASNKAPKAAIQTAGGWTAAPLAYVGHQFGLFPGVTVAANGTIYASFSRYRANATAFDTGVYLARLAAGGSWDVSMISDDYSGGPTRIGLDGSGKPVVAYRYLRKSLDYGNAAGVRLATLQTNGTWSTETVFGEFGLNGDTYGYDYLNLAFSGSGEPRLSYYFTQALYLTNPALSAIRLHGSAGSGSATTTSSIASTTTTSVPTTTTTSVSTTTTSLPTTTTSVPTTSTSVPTTTTSRPTTTTSRATTSTTAPTTSSRPSTTTSIAPTTTTSAPTTTSSRPSTTTSAPPTTTSSTVPTTSTTSSTVPATTTTSLATTSSTSTSSTSTSTTTSSTTTTSVLAMVPVKRINSGGNAYTDSAGFVWQKDGWFVGGSKSSKNVAVYGTADYKLYQSEHSGKAFRYSMPVANGVYMVRLHFAETNYKLPGQRIFHVTLENSPALSFFDILRQAPRSTAVFKTFFVPVTDGVLDAAFYGVKNSAKVSAIEVQALPPDGLQINSGGSTEIDSAGQLWIADTGFFGGYTLTAGSQMRGASSQSVSQSIRFGPYFGYRIPVPNGTYDVVLHFVEPYYDTAGMRVFSCLFEGQNEFPGLDIFSLAGQNNELALGATTTVNDGILTLDFVADYPGHTPVVSAIEIHRSDQWAAR